MDECALVAAFNWDESIDRTVRGDGEIPLDALHIVIPVEIGKKKETYDDIINRLIDFYLANQGDRR